MEDKVKRAKNLCVFGIVFALISFVVYFVLLQTGVFFDTDDADFGEGIAMAITIVYVAPFYGGSAILAVVSYICNIVASKKMLNGECLQNGRLITAIVFNSIALALCAVALFFGITLNIPQGIWVGVYFIFLIITLVATCKQKGRVKELLFLQAEREKSAVVDEAALS
ncbi:MAG: hypothetical protein IJY38_00835 [Clostridia bacterium]|nr:hypothetical protein [Clostridia bacterium]